MRPLPVAVRDYRPWLQCSETGHWFECRRQCTCDQVPREDRQRVIKDSTGAGHPWHDTRLQRQLPPSFPGCPASHPRSGNQTLRVVQAHCVWPNVISRYSTFRSLILEREKKVQDSLTSLINIAHQHMLTRNKNFFTVRFWNKFALKSLYISNRTCQFRYCAWNYIMYSCCRNARDKGITTPQYITCKYWFYDGSC